jgi:hypothetical protein
MILDTNAVSDFADANQRLLNCLQLSPKLQKQFDLLDFARARPWQYCLGRTEGR